MNRLAFFLRIAVGALFAYAGWLKVTSPGQFATDIEHYRLLPYFMIHPLAFYLPWLEIVSGAAVILGPGRHGGLALLLALTLVFATAIGSALARHLDISCGCFGSLDTQSLGLSLGRDILLGLALLWLLLRSAGPGEDHFTS
jgi:uncharacterized membrane protein YphA (DoxX/SURF4 family)